MCNSQDARPDQLETESCLPPSKVDKLPSYSSALVRGGKSANAPGLWREMVLLVEVLVSVTVTLSSLRRLGAGAVQSNLMARASRRKTVRTTTLLAVSRGMTPIWVSPSVNKSAQPENNKHMIGSRARMAA